MAIIFALSTKYELVALSESELDEEIWTVVTSVNEKGNQFAKL